MNKDFKRTDKMAQLIQQELSRIIQREVRDPRLPKWVTLSRVVVSPDLSHAKIFITVLGEKEDAEQALAVLNHASAYLRSSLSQSINLRVTPELHFIYDEVLEKANHLSRLISELDTGDDENT